MSKINYISCASWEERFIDSLVYDYNKYKYNNIVLFYFNDEKFKGLSETSVHLTNEFAKKNGITLNIVEVGFENQIEIFTQATSILSLQLSDQNYLNITTMPRHLLYVTLDILQKSQNPFDVLYYVPEKYGNEIAKNPEVPQLLLKHSGIFEADKETLLIISAGLDKERIFQLYYYFEPKKIVIIEEKNNYANINERDRDSFRSDLEELNAEYYIRDSFDANNITSFLQNDLSNEIETYNTLLCAIGPKIASLELFKYNLINPRCGIVFALSREYSKDYSIGIDLENCFVRASEFFKVT